MQAEDAAEPLCRRQGLVRRLSVDIEDPGKGKDKVGLLLQMQVGLRIQGGDTIFFASTTARSRTFPGQIHPVASAACFRVVSSSIARCAICEALS